MSYLNWIRICLTLLFLVIAALIDARSRKIPNILTFPMILLGIGVNILFSPGHLLTAATWMLICLLFSFLPGIGMGDVKLLIGMGLFISCIDVAIITAVASLLVLITQIIKYPYATISFITNLLHHRQLHSIQKQMEIQPKTKDNSVAFAPFLLLATLLIEGGVILVSYI